jgi:hypothetical protein
MTSTEQLRADFLRKLGPDYASAYPRLLEQSFPHILEKIAVLWGSRDMEPYFENLLVTRRPGRAGFPTEVASELIRLFSIYHKMGLAQRDPEQMVDIWNWSDHVGYFGKKTAS